MKLAGILKAAELGTRMARVEVKAAVNRAAKNAAFAAALGILAILAFGFALAAFAVWLAGEIGTVAALGYIALGFLILAIIVYIVWRVSMGGKPQPRKPQPSPLAAALDGDPQESGQEPPTGSTLGSLGVVALVGFMMARQLFRR
ncbi:MAG: phage holin family protein [Bauldia sp.]|nr:phage holin family protein [Bauldia sp.]